MTTTYHPHLSHPGYGWIEPFMDSACPLIEEQIALDIVAQIEQDEALLARLAKWIVHHPSNSGGDHACALCYPHSDMLKAGFVCAYHEAERIVNTAAKPVIRRSNHG